MSTHATRTILTDWTDSDGHVTRATETAPATGDVHRVVSPQLAAHEAQATWHDLGALVQDLEPLIGWPKMDAILSLINALQMDVRVEAISRMVHAAGGMLDYPVSVYLVLNADDPDLQVPPFPLPRGEGTIREAAGDDEALARAVQAELLAWMERTPS